MAKRPTPRAEAREIATASKPPSMTRESRDTTSSTAIDINRERMEPLDSGVASSGPNEDDIRRRAYQRYLERGGAPGSDFDDWLEAERELRGSKSQV
jgi:Protein of unknown function (DUF2934)